MAGNGFRDGESKDDSDTSPGESDNEESAGKDSCSECSGLVDAVEQWE